MEDGGSRLSFDSGYELREAAENRFGRSLSAEEWDEIDPDGWSARPASYDQSDLDELLRAMAKLPAPAERSTLDRQRAQALAHRQRTAAEAKEFVGKDRIWLFGSPAPPFENAAAAAAAWIEAQAAEPATFLFTLTVAMPAQLEDIAPFLWLRDWLVSALPNRLPDDEQDRKAAFRFLLQDRRSPIRHIGNEAPLLAYLAPVESRRFEVKHIRADDGTILGNLLEAATRLAKATGWDQLAACHHLLTGGVMSAPVSARAHNRWGRESFGGPAISIEIRDPSGVSAEEVARAYVRAREGILRPADPPRRRSRPSAKRQRVVALVAETPELTWAKRRTLWNERHPDQRFPTPDALRQAYRRADRP